MTEQAAQRRPQIIVGVDGSPAARQALVFAVREAAVRNATLVAVMSLDPQDSAWLDPYAVGTRSDLDHVARAEEKLRSILADVGTADVQVDWLVTTEPAAAALIERSAGADLLVVGSRGRGEVRGLLMGSVSLHCVLHAHCPVTVVRPDRHPPDAAALALHARPTLEEALPTTPNT